MTFADGRMLRQHQLCQTCKPLLSFIADCNVAMHLIEYIFLVNPALYANPVILSEL